MLGGMQIASIEIHPDGRIVVSRAATAHHSTNPWDEELHGREKWADDDM